jgi:dTDP-4-amino-4,6-dideoxygalactose transaminase
MAARRIGCSVHFIPIVLHPYYAETLNNPDPCNRSVSEYERLVSLPIYSKMTDQDVWRVIQAVREIVDANRKTVVFVGGTQPVEISA